MRTAIPSSTNITAGASARSRVQAAVIVLGILTGFACLAVVSPQDLDRMPQLCLWSYLLGGPCPACGTLHALCWAVHGDLGRAMSCNRNVLLLVPVSLWVWIGQLRVLFRRAPVLGL